ncbi:phosphatidylinositol 3 [Tropilaelaps mercedesae]|uniref:Phosphatidylinositol 3,4,5-trisphosphate 3-phosphatase and dual-specificity protein phosphatase PTEN n=1 Tax=Tropilaelaps mercedesae TaxID=418985 RepID=A0A1V9X9J4_9ACAR|nr:phosphatidylinositol 3 [Tropilaelaps mercedesae]
MADHLRAAVSRNKRRYKCDGYNLDLSYIEPAIIAMGYPAEKLESMYRNQVDQVAKFLNEKHKDRYKIYNLCKERQKNKYPKDKFTGHVCDDFSFEDHAPPPLEKIEPFCRDVQEWLSKDPENVIAVHCKAGKGRTGVMICCYLVHCGRFKNADEALKHYAKVRTVDEKGVTIPSQRRYVEYYARMRGSSLQYENTRLLLRTVTLDNIPLVNAIGASMGFTVYYANDRKKSVNMGETRNKNTPWQFNLPESIEVHGDVRIEFYINRFVPGVKEKICAVCFNTFFIEADVNSGGVGSSGPGNRNSSSISGSRPSSISFSLGSSTVTADSHENGQEQRPYSEPPGEHMTASALNSSSFSCGQTEGSVGYGAVSGRYRVLSLNKSQLDKACKTKEFPETALIRLLFDPSIRHPAASGNGNDSGSVAESGSGSEERRNEGGSPAEDDSSEEDETSCVRM